LDSSSFYDNDDSLSLIRVAINQLHDLFTLVHNHMTNHDITVESSLYRGNHMIGKKIW